MGRTIACGKLTVTKPIKPATEKPSFQGSQLGFFMNDYGRLVEIRGHNTNCYHGGMRMGLQSEIKDAVNWEAPTVSLQSSLREVIQKLVGSNTSALVVKSDDAVVGLVSDMDLVDCISNQKDMDKTTVSEFLTPCELITDKRTKRSPCAQLDESQSVENAIKVLAAAGTHNLLVSGASDKEVGITSIHNLLKLLLS